MLSDDFQFVSYVLDTSEIKVTHTSDMLRSHLHNLLKYNEFVAGNEQQITYTFNAINLNDIHEEDMECQGEVTFLSTETDLGEIQIDEDVTQELQCLPPPFFSYINHPALVSILSLSNNALTKSVKAETHMQTPIHYYHMK